MAKKETQKAVLQCSPVFSFYKIAASKYSIYGCAKFSNKTKKEGKNIEVFGITAKLKMVQ